MTEERNQRKVYKVAWYQTKWIKQSQLSLKQRKPPYLWQTYEIF